jgi:excisionase family DNA binding protein
MPSIIDPGTSANHGAVGKHGGDHAPVDRLLTADDLAERWQVRPGQVYRLTREGRLSPVRIGRYYRYRLSSIEAFELEGGVGADG